MNLPDLMFRLGQARQVSQKAYQTYQTAKEAEDKVRDELEAKLRAEGLRSAKDDRYVVSIASKPTIRVTDERAAMDWVKHQPNIDHELYIGLKKTAFDGLAKLALKKDGELVPGVEIENNEYLAIRKGGGKWQ